MARENTHQLWPASGQQWAGPRPGLHSPFLPGVAFMITMKLKRAFGGSIPQNHLELTVKSELYNFWPKLTLTSNMDIVDPHD